MNGLQDCLKLESAPNVNLPIGTEKRCSRCLETKSINEFYKCKNKYRKLCKNCQRKAVNKENRKEYIKKYNKENERRLQEYRKKWFQKNKYRLNYNITSKDVDNMLIKQNYKCAICDRPLIETKRNIDHNHKTNKVRGLLCAKCNHGLGMFNDDLNLLKKAVFYIKNN